MRKGKMGKNTEKIIMTGALLLPLISYCAIIHFGVGPINLYVIVFLLSASVLAVTSVVGLVRALRSSSQYEKKCLLSSFCMSALGISLSLTMLGLFVSFIGCRGCEAPLILNVFAILALLLSVAQVIISWRKNADKWGMIVGLAALVYILLGPLEAILGEP